MKERLSLGAMLFVVLMPLAIVRLAQRPQLGKLIAPDPFVTGQDLAHELAQVVALGHDLIVAPAR